MPYRNTRVNLPTTSHPVVLDEVRHRQYRIYRRARALLRKLSHSYVFCNEFHREAYVERNPSESPNDRNDRSDHSTPQHTTAPDKTRQDQTRPDKTRREDRRDDRRDDRRERSGQPRVRGRREERGSEEEAICRARHLANYARVVAILSHISSHLISSHPTHLISSHCVSLSPTARHVLLSAIRAATQWYARHLEGRVAVNLVTNDAENKRQALAAVRHHCAPAPHQHRTSTASCLAVDVGREAETRVP